MECNYVFHLSEVAISESGGVDVGAVDGTRNWPSTQLDWHYLAELISAGRPFEGSFRRKECNWRAAPLTVTTHKREREYCVDRHEQQVSLKGSCSSLCLFVCLFVCVCVDYVLGYFLDTKPGEFLKIINNNNHLLLLFLFLSTCYYIQSAHTHSTLLGCQAQLPQNLPHGGRWVLVLGQLGRRLLRYLEAPLSRRPGGRVATERVREY